MSIRNKFLMMTPLLEDMKKMNEQTESEKKESANHDEKSDNKR